MSKSSLNLNSEQKKAVVSIRGPVLILAGAGAGKTKTIAERIRHLVETGVAPSAILAITFTNKAVRETLLTLGLDPKTHDPGRIMSIISREKGQGLGVEDYGGRGEHGYFPNIVKQTWSGYEKVLKRDNALDFDDLLLKTMNLLSDNQAVREFYQNIWEYIHIDEYQDTNRVQYEISKMLAGKNQNICVVGDIDQNIYSWRGADIKNILDFEKDYPDARVITLEENYRST